MSNGPLTEISLTVGVFSHSGYPIGQFTAQNKWTTQLNWTQVDNKTLRSIISLNNDILHQHTCTGRLVTVRTVCTHQTHRSWHTVGYSNEERLIETFGGRLLIDGKFFVVFAKTVTIFQNEFNFRVVWRFSRCFPGREKTAHSHKHTRTISQMCQSAHFQATALATLELNSFRSFLVAFKNFTHANTPLAADPGEGNTEMKTSWTRYSRCGSIFSLCHFELTPRFSFDSINL